MISDRDRAILNCIAESWELRNSSPSFREIAKTIGVSLSTVVRRVENLTTRGLILRDAASRRGLRVATPLFGSRHRLIFTVANTVPSKSVLPSGKTRIFNLNSIVEDDKAYVTVVVDGDEYKEFNLSNGDVLICEKNKTPTVGDLILILTERGVLEIRVHVELGLQAIELCAVVAVVVRSLIPDGSE